MDSVPSLILRKNWDTIESNSKQRVVFVSIKVVNSRVKVDIVHIAWLALFDPRGVDDHHQCITPILKLIAYDEPLRLFEVLVVDYIEGRGGPIDAVIGIIPRTCPRGYELHIGVYDSQKTSRKIFNPDYSRNRQELDSVKPSGVYKVQSLWKDTIIPIVNPVTSLIIAESKQPSKESRLLCAVFDPWMKLNVSTARSVVLPDGSEWPHNSDSFEFNTSYELPDISSPQILQGSRQRCQERSREISKELAEAVWHPMRLMRMGVFHGALPHNPARATALDLSEL